MRSATSSSVGHPRAAGCRVIGRAPRSGADLLRQRRSGRPATRPSAIRAAISICRPRRFSRSAMASPTGGSPIRTSRSALDGPTWTASWRRRSRSRMPASARPRRRLPLRARRRRERRPAANGNEGVREDRTRPGERGTVVLLVPVKDLNFPAATGVPSWNQGISNAWSDPALTGHAFYPRT